MRRAPATRALLPTDRWSMKARITRSFRIAVRYDHTWPCARHMVTWSRGISLVYKGHDGTHYLSLWQNEPLRFADFPL